jgi:hypothetical protein
MHRPHGSQPEPYTEVWIVLGVLLALLATTVVVVLVAGAAGLAALPPTMYAVARVLRVVHDDPSRHRPGRVRPPVGPPVVRRGKDAES